VAHRLSTIARAERIAVLEGGGITEMGSYSELVRLIDRSEVLYCIANLVQVAQPDSRFRALMAAQLNNGPRSTLKEPYSDEARQRPGGAE